MTETESGGAAVELKSQIEAELNEHYQKKREIEDNINVLTGRPTRKQREEAALNGEELPPHPASRDRRRISANDLPPGRPAFANARSRLPLGDRLGGGARRRAYPDDDQDQGGYNNVGPKRNRLSLNERFGGGGGDVGGERDARMGGYGRQRRTATEAFGRAYVDADIIDEVKGKPVQSEIVMPIIDTKSRDEAIKEQESDVKPAVKQRNRRMFANILGTLNNFRKTKTAHEDEQKKKQEEIDRKLEEDKRRSKEEMLFEKRKLVAKTREEQEKIKQLQRKRAMIQIADREIDRMKLLSNFIMLSGKPPIFYTPGKHTLRTLELQKTTKRRFEDRIAARRDELEKDLKAADEKAAGRQTGRGGGDDDGERAEDVWARWQKEKDEEKGRERANTEEREQIRQERANDDVDAVDAERMRERRNMVTPTSADGDAGEEEEEEDDGAAETEKKPAVVANGGDKVKASKESKKESPKKESPKKANKTKSPKKEAKSDSGSSDDSSSSSDDDD